MTSTRRPVTGALLIASAALFIVGFAVLAPAFGWPGVLDEPGTVTLDRYVAAETSIRVGFYAMTLSSLVLIPGAFGLHAAFGRDDALARTITSFGVLGAFAQLLGWLRWVIAVPVQADLWLAAGEDTQARHAVATAFDTLNAYAGGTVGEHLGWLLQGLWAVGVFVLVLRVVGIPRWLAWSGLVVSAGWAILVPIGTAADVMWAEIIGVSALYSLWYVLMVVLGVVLITRHVGALHPEPPPRG